MFLLRTNTIIIFLIATFCCEKVVAQPVFTSAIVIEGEKLYRDTKKNNLWYYIPSGYQLLSDAEGKPAFTLTKMVYTGTIAAGDDGVRKYNNIIQFKIGIDTGHHRKIILLKASLKSLYPNSELRMMPVRKFSSILVFAASEINQPGDSMRVVKTGYAEPTDENADINNSYWNERIVTFRINNTDAQLVESALRNRQTAMSFSYAFYSAFSDTAGNEVSIVGNDKLKKEVMEIFNQQEKDKKDSASVITMIKADAIPLKVDISKWPGAIQQIDINEKVPARFPVFYIYCYDFNNDLRYDLFAKKVEIKATSVNGSAISTSFTFKQSLPDQYARNIVFPYAVRFDKPFYYRVMEISNDGEMVKSEWIEKKSWNEIIDITSPPDKVVRRVKENDD